VRRLRRAATEAESIRGSFTLVTPHGVSTAGVISRRAGERRKAGAVLKELWLRRADAPRSLHSGSLRSG